MEMNLDLLTSKEMHVNHIFEKGLKNEEVLEMYKEDVFDWYIVSEYFSNHARLHLISAPSEDEALQDVYTYILENENDNDPDIEIHLTSVDKVELNNEQKK